MNPTYYQQQQNNQIPGLIQSYFDESLGYRVVKYKQVYHLPCQEEITRQDMLDAAVHQYFETGDSGYLEEANTLSDPYDWKKAVNVGV